MSGRYVCGAGLEEDWSDKGGEPRDEDDEECEGLGDEGRQEERTEVGIMEIARPMKLRGALSCCSIAGWLLTNGDALYDQVQRWITRSSAEFVPRLCSRMRMRMSGSGSGMLGWREKMTIGKPSEKQLQVGHPMQRFCNDR